MPGMFGPIRKRKSPLYIATSIVLIVILAIAAGSAAVVIAILVLLTVLFYPLFLVIWDKLYGVEDIADQLFYAHTDDGWNIAMHFHRPTYPRVGAFPVILSHGIANNKYGVDMDHSHSLAYYLKQHGFPVFVLSLRGVGKSYHASRYGYRDFNFDDIVQSDVPAVIRKARELTGAPKISWVGHSMGAMVAYGFMGRKLDGHEDIAAFVSLGGPGRIDHARRTIWGALSSYPWVNEILDFKFGAQVISPLTGRFTTPVEELIYSKDNVNSRTVRRLMKNGIENISQGLARQFMDWIKTNRETTVDGSHDYREGLRNIKTPSLYLSGARDHIAVPESVKFVHDQSTSKHKEYVMLGRESGSEVDYCHTGLVLGDRAIQDVFPRVLAWLETHGREKRGRNVFARIIRRVQKRREHRRERRRGNRPPGKYRAPANRPSSVIQA